ncbi:MAG: phosphate acetyltransferase [Pseudomonadales bacterium]|nr:phosphate acetyltransferase [Pseudomonadales bacterium]
MDFIHDLKRRLQSISHRIVFPEGDDIRIIQAARCLSDDNIAEIVLLGDSTDITQAADRNKISLHDLEVINPETSDDCDRYAVSYVENRGRTKLSIASRIVKKPLNYGAMMVKMGQVDLMVAGACHATKKVIEAAGSCVGLAESSRVPSSFFIMNFADRKPLVFADCAVNTDPTAEALADIAILTAFNAQKILQAPAKVALLSFSTKGSGNHASIDKLKRALQIAQAKAPELDIDGELQVDSALVKSVAAHKLNDIGAVAGQANVLIFPDLNAANIGYKLVQHLANAEAIGPILQGFSLPVADLSRGSTVDEIVATSIVALTMKLAR